MKLFKSLLAAMTFVFGVMLIASSSSATTTTESAVTNAAQVQEVNMSVPLDDIGAEEVGETRCWGCRSDSKGACGGGKVYCYGDRKSCTKKGCKISGSKGSCGSSDKQC